MINGLPKLKIYVFESAFDCFSQLNLGELVLLEKGYELEKLYFFIELSHLNFLKQLLMLFFRQDSEVRVFQTVELKMARW